MPRPSKIFQQFAALPVFQSSTRECDVGLVTVRDGERWIIPKGNPIRGLAPHEVAAREAFEEAGLVGEIGSQPIGSFVFPRARKDNGRICDVIVFLLRVKRQLYSWPEKSSRGVIRCEVEAAIQLVRLPDLAMLIRQHAVPHFRDADKPQLAEWAALHPG